MCVCVHVCVCAYMHVFVQVWMSVHARAQYGCVCTHGRTLCSVMKCTCVPNCMPVLLGLSACARADGLACSGQRASSRAPCSEADGSEGLKRGCQYYKFMTLVFAFSELAPLVAVLGMFTGLTKAQVFGDLPRQPAFCATGKL